MERKLVSIKKIDDIQPIENADLIECAMIGGWNIVVRKEEKLKVNDLVVYAEIDTILPENNPNFTFLKGKPIKTKKMRGVISQGVIFPLNCLPPAEYQENDDVTGVIGAIKYDPSLENEMKNKNNPFPSFVPKTELERVQALKTELPNHKDDEFIIQEKLDGCSITIYYDEETGRKGICSRNYEIELDNNNPYAIAGVPILEKLIVFGRSIALQGELVGGKIQSNRYRIDGYKVKCFQAWDIQEQKYLSNDKFLDMCEDLEIETVPILSIDEHIDKLHIKSWLNLAEGTSALYDTEREGIVARTLDNSFVFKAISNQFLLKD